jgi:general secretion pathway protein D
VTKPTVLPRILRGVSSHPLRAAVTVSLLTWAFGGCATAAKTAPAATAEPPPAKVEVRAEPPRPQAAPTPPVVVSPGPAPTQAPAPPVAAPAAPPRLPFLAPGPAPTPTPTPSRRFVVFNFDNADVEVVIQAASEIVGFSYVIAPAVRGRKVTVQTQGRISSDEVFGVLLTILDVNGLAAVKSGNLYRIIPREGAVQTSVRTIVGRDLDETVAGDQVITQIVALQYVSATDMASLLRPFVPSQGAVTAHRETNLLILTDTAANVRRLLEIVRLTDVQVALEDIQIIPLKYADAQELAQLLTQLFASGRLRASTPSAPAAPALPTAPGAPIRPPPPGAEPGPDRVPLIVAERRSNSLVVHARKQDMDTIQRLIAQLDVDVYGGQRVFIYFVENSKARDLAATLDAIYGRGAGPAVTGSQTTTRTGPEYTRPGGAPGTPPPPAPTPPPPRSPGAATGRPAGPGEDGSLPGDVRFIADEVTNAVIVVTYPRNWKEVEDTIKRLDKMPRQVLIEVLAAEVTLTDDTKLGIEWAIRSGRFDASYSRPAGSTGVIPSRPPENLIPFGGIVAPPGLNFFTFATDKFLAALNALAAENKVNVLSSPSIMTTENKKAVINVSRSVPILTGQQVPIGATPSTGTPSIIGTQTVEYRDAGIILTVTPRIGEQGTVALDVKQEVNDVGDPVPPTNSPEFKKREAETSVVLVNNQTLVLGGLIQNRRTVVRSGIPFLSRIPVLGYLFGSREEKIEKTELLLLITPRVVGTALEAARITEEMRRITPEIAESVRSSPRPPSQ